MRKYGLLGYPLGHSLSDYIHRRIFEMCGLTDECEYNLYEVNPDELSFKGDKIRELSGYNVTIPYKTEILPYLTRLDASAASYGAVNCVKTLETRDEDGKVQHVGHNTDGFGFLKAVERLTGKPLKESKKVLLLGCGGTGRMMAIESVKNGADLTVAIRRSPSAQKAAAKLSQDISALTGKFDASFRTLQIGQSAQLEALGAGRGLGRMRITYTDSLNIVNSYDLLLNATPCGMYPHADEMPLSPAILGKVTHLFDAVYNPAPTKLIQTAESRGVKCLDGMTMLVYQAVMSQRIWNDIEISDASVAQIIQECHERTKK
ncbi:MAG: shikimate dehydrogenase [Oscillospiraceae bacterium]|nr:shikimate dehydrogenase [Oscillospiraceae bacterium]